jgi:hypothetical protein
MKKGLNIYLLVAAVCLMIVATLFLVLSGRDSDDGEAEQVADIPGFVVIDETEVCDSALELVYVEDNLKYSFPCIQSHSVFIEFTDGRRMTVKEALEGGYVTIREITEKYPVLFHIEGDIEVHGDF